VIMKNRNIRTILFMIIRIEIPYKVTKKTIELNESGINILYV